jgi:chromosome partitioning protein
MFEHLKNLSQMIKTNQLGQDKAIKNEAHEMKIHSGNSNKAFVISLINQKGGVGKTTLTYNLACALRFKGKKVLCLDFDPQANLSQTLKSYYHQNHQDFLIKNNDEFSIFHLLINTLKELKTIHRPISLADVLIRSPSPALPDLLPADQMLSGLELTVASIQVPRQLILKRFLDRSGLMEMYDYILIDGPPTLGLLFVNILCASSGVLCPFIPDAFARNGINHLRKVIEDIADAEIINPPPILGLIPNLFDKRRKFAQAELDSIKNQFSEYYLFEAIENKVELFKAMGNQKSIFEYQSKDFKIVQNQLLTIVENIIQRNNNEHSKFQD